jgi:hypothetical protein
MTTYVVRRDEMGRMQPLSEIMSGIERAPAARTGHGSQRSPLRLQIEAMEVGDEIEVTDRNADQISAIASHVRAQRPGAVYRVTTAPTCAIVRRIA